MIYITQRIIPEVRAVQPGNSVTERCKCAADLPIASLAHSDVPLAAVVVEAREYELAAPVVKLYAEVADHLLVERLKTAVEADAILLRLSEFGVRHTVREVAVVGEK